MPCFADLSQLMERFSKDQRVKQALEEGVDLREYARQVEEELKKTEMAAVQDYAEQADTFAEVHMQIRACDSILEQMESFLTGFQSSLGAISKEIRQLQEESTALSVKLANRQAVSLRVSEFVQSAVIPESMARDICESEVSESYLEYLVELNKRIDFAASSSRGGKTAPVAVQEVEPQLQKLKTKAVTRVREFLLQRIHALKKPRTNLQMIQHNVLSKYKYMNVFLQTHATNVYEEILASYVDTLSKLYLTHFKAYLAGLGRLELPVGSKYDMLGTEPEKLKSWTDKFTATAKNVFALGNRDAVLQNIDADAIVPHEAAEKNLKYTYDLLFRSLNQYLLDCVTSEWLFCIEWFGPNDLFPKIFNAPLQLCLQSISTSVRGSFDAIGLLIMLRINSFNKQTMVRRGIPVLVPYFQKLDQLILPRFQEMMSFHSMSAKTFVVPASNDVRPHFIVRRYAEFLTSLLVLTNNYKHPDVIQCMNSLREEMTQLLDRLANAIPSDPKERDRKRQIFLITNLDLILSLLRDKELVSTESVLFEERMEATINSFVMDQLQTYFLPLINFVKSTDAGKPAEKDAADAVVKSLNKTWKGDVQKMCQGVLFNGFSNFSLAGAVCRKMLLELTKFNSRCWDIIKEAFGPNAFTKFYLAPFQLRDEFIAVTKQLGLENII